MRILKTGNGITQFSLDCFASRDVFRLIPRKKKYLNDDKNTVRCYWFAYADHNDPFQLFMYEAMGLCPQGRGGELIDSAQWISNKNGKIYMYQ